MTSSVASSLFFRPLRAPCEQASLQKGGSVCGLILEFRRDPYRPETSSVDSKAISRVMLQHKGHIIHTFRLHYTADDSSDTELESWIDTVIEGNVRYLVMELSHQLKLPRCLFTGGKTLVDLTLRNCSDIPKGCTVCFPALKKLELDGVAYKSDESLTGLLSGCPVLEELVIKMGYYRINIWVCLPTLTKLSINTAYGYQRVYRMKLDTPALKYLHLYSNRFEIFSTVTLTSLIEAHVAFHAQTFIDSDDDSDSEDGDGIERMDMYSRSVVEFVGKLYNVKFLELSSNLGDPYSKSFALTPKFHNLTELKLYDGCGCRFLSTLLENAESLRLLTIGGHFFEYWMEPKQVPTCLISCLETVNLVESEWSMEIEFDIVKYILKNGKALKEMNIIARRSGYNRRNERDSMKEEFEALKRLALFERGSTACQLSFEIITS